MPLTLSNLAAVIQEASSPTSITMTSIWLAWKTSHYLFIKYSVLVRTKIISCLLILNKLYEIFNCTKIRTKDTSLHSHSEYMLKDTYTNCMLFESSLLIEQYFIPKIFFALWPFEIIDFWQFWRTTCPFLSMSIL